MKPKEQHINASDIDFGKLPPQAVDIENLLIGALMIESDAFERIADILTAEMFYDKQNAVIFQAINELSNDGHNVDSLLVTNKLRKNGTIDEAGGVHRIAVLQSAINSTANLETHARIIYEKYISRQIITTCYQVQEMAYSEGYTADEIMFTITEKLKSIETVKSGGVMSMVDVVTEMVDNIKKNISFDGKFTGTPTGFKMFDERSGGFQQGDFIVIAAESSQGKTSLALSMARNMAITYGAKIGLYSLEMTAIQLGARITSIETGMAANVILYQKFNDEMYYKIDSKLARICNAEIYIDDSITSNLNSIVMSIRSLVKKQGICGVFVDYLQLVNVSDRSMNKEQQTAYIARTFKNLAKELKIWICAMSQLARENTNPVPSIKRLRDSGQIEEAADVVFLIYRPEYYSRQHIDDFKTIDTKGTAMIDVAKGRNIGVFKFITHFNAATTHFFDDGDYDYIEPDDKDPF